MTLINGQKVTFSDGLRSNGQSAGTPAERETTPELSTVHPDRLTVRDRIAGLVEASRAYWVPPNLLTQPPASVAELSDYAHHAGWTRRTDGPVRAFGIGWHRAVGLPITVVCRYAEWIAQRPGRALPVFGVWKLVILTGPGPDIADHIIRPALAFVAWVLL